MRKFIVPAVTAALLSITASSAKADMMSYLNDISSPSIGPLGFPLALVNLHQNGPDEVDVRVALDKNSKFAINDNQASENAFAFSLNLNTPYTETILTSGFLAETGTVGNTPYGTFTNGIQCVICGHLPQPGPLEFTITDISGISISNFVTNAGNYLFSTDIIGPLGGIGNIAVGGKGVSFNNILLSAPLPSSLPLFAAGLLGFGLYGRRRKHLAGQQA